MTDADIVKEFLVESYENLHRLDHDLTAFEKDPGRDTLASVFRRVITTCDYQFHSLVFRDPNGNLHEVGKKGGVVHARNPRVVTTQVSAEIDCI